ncbi:hypothetical protein ACH49M_28115 [Rhodococcus qingshengii]|jgi:hypothetical protein|uniref:hypothetical protein n=1 Tax=Actinomycetes TaxID=1760 RepID=UPI001C603422|nr:MULTISPECIES: hypothetical protein [Rhodococcus]MBW4818151.1 hypothetical protein [Rhodococcus qingshengii]MCJ0905961.1 hypothetical protein [Rhodococcus sp. ARC_M6]
MAEEHTISTRSALESTLYQATKHLRVITAADLAAVVDGHTVESESAVPIDIAFPPPGNTEHLFN